MAGRKLRLKWIPQWQAWQVRPLSVLPSPGIIQFVADLNRLNVRDTR